MIEFFRADQSSILELPLAGDIKAGFPSPAEEYLEMAFDLNQSLVKHPNATFYGRVKGDSMKNAGINDGDILIIDRSLEPANGKRAVCYVDGEFTLKTLRVEKNRVWLLPENQDYEPIEITEDNDFMVWGIITYIIHKA